jgi:hypothetical protein
MKAPPMHESICRRLIALVLAAGISGAGCASWMGIYPWVGPATTMTVAAGRIEISAAFDKVSSLMTSLDYTISRTTTINGVALLNFMNECVPENGRERCEAMRRKHETTDEDIKHPENGLGFTFFREPQSNESIEAHFIILKDAGGSVGISVSFWDRFQAGSFVATSGGRDMFPEGFSQTAVDDFHKMIASFARSYGADHVTRP